MRLSRTGWNNVIIFSVMIIIIFLNFTNDKLFRRDQSGAYSQDISLFSEPAVILSLSINKLITIERLGKSWRITPIKHNLSEQAVEQMMLSWQRATGTTATLKYDLSMQTATLVSVVVAGKEQAYELSLYPTQDQLLIFNQQSKQWLSLPLAIYYQLLPPQILAAIRKNG
jgi:hypothetical protein